MLNMAMGTKEMQDTKREFLEILCSLYMIILLGVLPLYMADGYYRLGDVKYTLFWNTTVLCMGVWLVLEVFCTLYKVLFQKQRIEINGICLGMVDIFVLAYGGCVLLSAICSDYDSAWTGYADWHMGAVSQLLFVGIYFFVSRYYGYDRLSLYGGEAAFLAVVLIGFLNRLEFDPVGTFQVLTENDWEYSHMISTTGNINWFCGYCSVSLALPISGYLYSRRKEKAFILSVVSVLGLILLVIQGSDSGLVLAAVAIGCCLLAGIKRTDFFQKGLLLLVGTSLGVRLMGQMIELLHAWKATPVDSWIYEKLLWNGWFVLAGIAAFGYWGCNQLRNRVGEATLGCFIRGFLAVVILTAVTLAFFVVLKWRSENFDGWGSGRGVLWKLAWEGFLQADFGEKLIGAGPDCYAEYLISIGKTPIITDEGRWANAIFANAHNEWFNQLVNVGLMGVSCYAGIFIAALRRYRGMMLGVLVLALYGVHSLVSFQQVLNAPLLFAVLGLCEATYRRKIAVNDLTRE